MRHQLVSIIIPCYQQGRYLSEAIDSALNQAYRNIEVIVVNDGSDDETDVVARGYGNRIQYIAQTNAGVAAARNTGIQQAKGTWLQFLDADDLMLPNKISDQLCTVADSSKTDLLYSDYLCFRDEDPDKKWKYLPVAIAEEDLFQTFLFEWGVTSTLPHHCALFHRRCFEQWGQYDPALPRHEDLDWLLRCAGSGARFQYIPGETSLYRVTTSSRSRGSSSQQDMLVGKYACLEKHATNQQLNKKHRQMVKNKLADERCDYLFQKLESGKYSEAVKHLTKITLYAPLAFPLIAVWCKLIGTTVSWFCGKLMKKIAKFFTSTKQKRSGVAIHSESSPD